MSNFTKASQLLRCVFRTNVCQLRYKKSPKQQVIDEDLSWATPILEQHMAKKEGKPQDDKEISKLHMVTRVKPLNGRPYWEKDVCFKYGLHEKLHKKIILKNTPSVNTDLQMISHLVKIIPVTFPYGLPQSEEDYEHCILQDNGEFVVKKKLEPIIEHNIAIDTEPKSSIWDMDVEELKKHSRKKLDNWDLNSEFFTTDYVYEHNQDGKEYRYFGDKSMGGKRKKWY